MKKRRRILIILGLVVVLMAAGGVYLATRPTSGNPQAALAQLLAKAQTVPVVRTTLANSVDSTGSLAPLTSLSLPFGASGTVQTVKVVVGDRVKKGDVLATLDPTDLQLKVTQAQQTYLIQQLTYSDTIQPDPRDVALAQAAYDNAVASYRAAQVDFDNLALKQTTQCSQLTSAQQSLDRAQTAYDRIANDHQASQYLNADWGPYQNIVKALENAQDAYAQAVSNCNIAKLSLNDSSLRSARAQMESAKNSLDTLTSPRAEKQIQAAAKLEQARLSLVQAQRNLAEATLVAPFDGVVTAVNAKVGVAASGAALVLANLSQLHVDVLVDETQIEAVKPGQKVALTLDAMTGITLTGQVDRIDPMGTVSQGVVNYNVRVNLDPTDTALRLDMTANAAILGETHENVLAVPTSAVRTGGIGAFAGQGRQPATGQGTPGGQGVTGGRPVTDTQAAGGQARQQRVTGPFVLVLENGQPRVVQVTEGLTAGDLVEVTGDLKEGDLVVVGELTLPTGTRQNGGFGGGFPGGGGGFPGGGPGAGGPPPF